MTNAEQLKSALLSHGGIEGVRVAVMQSVEEEAVVDDNRKTIGINKLNNFEFKDEILVAWRAYGMGKGKEIPLETTSEATSEHGIGWLSSEFSSGDFKPLSPNRLSQGRSKRRKWSRFMIPLTIQMNRHPCLPALRMGVLRSFKGCLLSKNTYL